MTTVYTIPPKVTPQVRSAPKVRQVYWCDFPEDAQLPEFWKRRPVIVTSYNGHTLNGAVTIVPCTTKEQGNNKWAFSLRTSIEEAKSWAICDKISTVAVSRLTVDRNGILSLPMNEFNEMLKIVLTWLPKVREY